MISGQLLIALMIAGAAFAFGLERAVRKVRAAQRRYKTMMAKRTAQVERLRRVGRESLGLKRELRQANLAVAEVAQECERLELEVARCLDPENRIFVLDERRTAGDSDWIALVQAPDLPPDARNAPPWRGERKFRVWAADEDGVRAKVARKYAPADGYAVTSVGPRIRQPAAPVAAPAA